MAINCTYRVEQRLCVILSVNADTFAIFQVNYVQRIVIHHEGVARSKTLWRDMAEVYELLN